MRSAIASFDRGQTLELFASEIDRGRAFAPGVSLEAGDHTQIELLLFSEDLQTLDLTAGPITTVANGGERLVVRWKGWRAFAVDLEGRAPGEWQEESEPSPALAMVRVPSERTRCERYAVERSPIPGLIRNAIALTPTVALAVSDLGTAYLIDDRAPREIPVHPPGVSFTKIARGAGSTLWFIAGARGLWRGTYTATAGLTLHQVANSTTAQLLAGLDASGDGDPPEVFAVDRSSGGLFRWDGVRFDRIALLPWPENATIGAVARVAPNEVIVVSNTHQVLYRVRRGEVTAETPVPRVARGQGTVAFVPGVGQLLGTGDGAIEIFNRGWRIHFEDGKALASLVRSIVPFEDGYLFAATGFGLVVSGARCARSFPTDLDLRAIVPLADQIVALTETEVVRLRPE